MTHAQISLQQHGLSSWSIKLLSVSVVAPSTAAASLPCQMQWARWCLDGSPFTPALIYMIIAFGVALILLTLVAALVYREVSKNSGKASSLSDRMQDTSVCGDPLPEAGLCSTRPCCACCTWSPI